MLRTPSFLVKADKVSQIGQEMQTWGLTGGIASGKTTVAKLFAALGLPGVDADAIYHRLLAPVGVAQGSEPGRPSPLAAAIGGAFPGTLNRDGQVDRRALGSIVFADPLARARLESITHPAVAEAATAELAGLERRGVAHALYDVPLLYERDLLARFAGVIVVWVPLPLQLERLCRRDGLSLATAKQRLAAQLSLDEKRARADFVVDNSRSLAETERQVATICHQLGASSERTMK